LDNFKGGDHLGDLSRDGKTILNWITNKHDVKMLTGFISLRIEFSGRHLQTWQLKTANSIGHSEYD
jgi:hypothetical protein